MPKSAKALLYMAICVVAALGVTAAKPDIAAAQPSAKAPAQIKQLEKKALKTESAIRFWKDQERGRWMLHLRHDKCWNIYGKQRRKLCRLGRGMLRFHLARLVKLESRIEKLTAPRDMGYLPPDQARELGRQMAEQFGWTGEQWNCLDALWGRYESSWYVYADNPTSTAYGIPQSTPGSKMASEGSNWQTSAYVQIKWGLKYISGKYGTPCSALSVRLATKSY